MSETKDSAPVASNPRHGHDVFLSHSRHDHAQASSLTGLLLQDGISVWRDRLLKYGEDFREEIDSQLRSCDVVLVLWSSNAAKSHWVRHEIGSALLLEKTIIPVLLDREPPPSGIRNLNGPRFEDWRLGDANHIEYRNLRDQLRDPGARRSGDWFELGEHLRWRLTLRGLVVLGVSNVAFFTLALAVSMFMTAHAVVTEIGITPFGARLIPVLMLGLGIVLLAVAFLLHWLMKPPVPQELLDART